MVHALIAAEIFFTSRLYFAIDPSLQPVLLAIPVVMCLWASAMLLLRLEVLPVVGVLAYVALLVTESQQFGRTTGFPQNINTLFQFGWGITFPFFYMVIRQGGLSYVLRTILIYSVIYLIIYIVIAASAQAGIQALLGRFLVAKDVERGERVIMHLTSALILWFWGLEQARAKRMIGLAALGLSALAIAYAQSRVYTACIVVVTLLRLAGTDRRLIRLICLSCFFVSVGVLCYGVFEARWNPFEFFGSESSGIARRKAYAIAVHFLQANQWLGVGLAGDPAALGYVVQDDWFSPSDLGPLGVWFSLGSFGLLLFCGLTLVACSYRPRMDLAPVDNGTFLLAGCTLGLYGIIAPTLIFGAGAYASIFVACWLSPMRAGAAREPSARRLVEPDLAQRRSGRSHASR